MIVIIIWIVYTSFPSVLFQESESNEQRFQRDNNKKGIHFY